jgi:hypothetical protein
MKPRVTQNFGSNWLNYVNCPLERLKASFEKTIEEGLIRIEITGANFFSRASKILLLLLL